MKYTINQIVEQFFKRRFPDKYIWFEIECGYFDEWVERFKKGNPEAFMDSESLSVWEAMKKEGITQ